MFGLGLHLWAIVVWSLGVAAAAAIAVVIATRVVIILQRGALKDSDEKIASALESAATANARAAEANLELAKLKERISPRALTPDQFEHLKALRGKVTELVVMSVSDAEAAMFALQIANALRALGIAVRYPPATNARVVAGVFVIFPPSMNRFERSAIATILSEAGMQSEGSPERTWLPPGDFPEDEIVIFVGQKPLTAPEGAEPAK